MSEGSCRRFPERLASTLVKSSRATGRCLHKNVCQITIIHKLSFSHKNNLHSPRVAFPFSLNETSINCTLHKDLGCENTSDFASSDSIDIPNSHDGCLVTAENTKSNGIRTGIRQFEVHTKFHENRSPAVYYV